MFGVQRPLPARSLPARSLQARAVRVRHGTDLRDAGAFAYSVHPSTSAGDKRQGVRRRTRLRSGKVLDLANGFVAECQIYDRSVAGARLRLLDGSEIPRAIRLYEDERESLVDADVVWRRGRECGIRIVGLVRGPGLSRSHLNALRGKYYTMRS